MHPARPLLPFMVLMAIAILALGACGGGGSGDGLEGTIPIRAPATEVTEGETLALTADTKVGPLTWISSDTRVACVDAEGGVLGCKKGSVRVTVRGPAPDWGFIDLRVVSDPTFNRSLPEEDGQLAPKLDRECSVPSCDVTLDLEGLAATVRSENHRPYHRLKLPQSGSLSALGRPELPFYTLRFAVPVDAQTFEPASWSVSVTRESPRTYEGMRPWPHQPPRGTPEDPASVEADPPFTVDEAFYESSTAWPEISYSARALTVGNLPIVEVMVVPAQYTPATQRLVLYRSTRVHVAFQGTGQLRMPRPLGDYKGTNEMSADSFITEVIQNRELVAPIEAGDLLATLPPLDTTGIKDLPFDLLILTRPELEVPAHRLAEWRQSRGTRVWLAVCDPAKFPDAASLLAVIQDLDELNRLDATGGFRPHAMRAICLFGDVEHIPTWEGLNQRNAAAPGPGDGPVPIVGTDLPYSTLRGLDWVSDVAMGRISVDDAVEGDAVVAKIEAYESIPDAERPHSASVWGLFDDRPEERAVLPGTVRFLSEETRVRGTGTHWLGQIQPGDVVRPAEGRAARSGEWPARVAAVVADDILELVDPWPNETITHTGGLQVGFQDGQDDWELVKATERVRRFLRGRGVEVEFGYVRNENPPTVPTPVRGFDGEPLASDLTGYAWDGDANQISTRWQRGIDGIVLYCGHGSPTRWLDPRFGKGDLGGVSGGPWYPIVLSICCHSGFFDSETDRVRVWNATTGVVDIVETTGTTGYGTHDVSFCEQVLREPGGGGIAAIGGSRGLDGGKNDRLVDGLLSAFYGDYFEGAILMGPGTRHAFEYLGDAVRAGKYTMHTWMLNPEPIGGAYSADDALYPLQAIHLFGDPMLKIRPSEGPADAK